MIKRTLYFGNPAYLKTRNEQLVVELPNQPHPKTAAIEDLGLVILDHAQITITQALLAKLLANNVAVISCNETHHPTGLFLNLDGHTLQSQRFQAQMVATQPLKKQLWQQTIVAKITNQANLLTRYRVPAKTLFTLAAKVQSGDATHCEAQAAAYYWKRLFPEFLQFTRHRDGPPPNNLLNYGYAILRALVARCLVGSGLLPTLGIHHRNQYNAYCLADDIMEPYRPYVDSLVCQLVRSHGPYLEMGSSLKAELLQIPAMDVILNQEKSPLMNAVQLTTASLARCFEGGSRKLLFPTLSSQLVEP